MHSADKTATTFGHDFDHYDVVLQLCFNDGVHKTHALSRKSTYACGLNRTPTECVQNMQNIDRQNENSMGRDRELHGTYLVLYHGISFWNII